MHAGGLGGFEVPGVFTAVASCTTIIILLATARTVLCFRFFPLLLLLLLLLLLRLLVLFVFFFFAAAVAAAATTVPTYCYCVWCCSSFCYSILRFCCCGCVRSACCGSRCCRCGCGCYRHCRHYWRWWKLEANFRGFLAYAGVGILFATASALLVQAGMMWDLSGMVFGLVKGSGDFGKLGIRVPEISKGSLNPTLRPYAASPDNQPEDVVL